MATVSVLLTQPTRAMVLTPDAERSLGAIADVRYASASGDAKTWDLGGLLEGAVACLTGWGTPPLTADVLARNPGLGLVAHTAGSIRNLVPADRVGDRLRVSQAAGQIAESVAELVILQILSSIRELHRLDAELRDGETWQAVRARHLGRLLGARTVGVVGASRTGRAVVRLLQAFGATVLVCDPLLDRSGAADLGVELTDLDTLLRRCDVVTLHAPLLPATEGLLGPRELALLRPGALLVNSARGGLVDGDALLSELRSGRIQAALDVFPAEPLDADSPWRSVPNALISPHAAGHTIDSHYRQGTAMVDEIGRFLAGEPLRYAVSPQQLATLA